MLYQHRPEPPQLRHRCRNPRCAGLLKASYHDRRAAFCCESCTARYFATRCLVCEAAIAKSSRRRVVCWRSKCRHELQRHPEKYRLQVGHNAAKMAAASPTAGLGHNAQENSAKSTLKTRYQIRSRVSLYLRSCLSTRNFQNWPVLPKPRGGLIGRPRRQSTSSAATNSQARRSRSRT